MLSVIVSKRLWRSDTWPPIKARPPAQARWPVGPLRGNARHLLNRYSHEAHIALGIFKAQQNRITAGSTDLVDATGNVVNGRHRLLRHFDDDVTRLHVSLRGRARGVHLQHDHTLDVGIQLVLGAKL